MVADGAGAAVVQLLLLLLVVAVALEFVPGHADAGRVAGLNAEGAL